MVPLAELRQLVARKIDMRKKGGLRIQGHAFQCHADEALHQRGLVGDVSREAVDGKNVVHCAGNVLIGSAMHRADE